uniref:Uncharacterized protein n=1 Tax=Toxoplasma gondii (strain ATCC 50861 / VEG) TaxID=432359 RepID=A0A0F7V1C3_TOXGV|nr:TPA: hypothetical protein BN1205_077230 [Toxoplasma gondii VEG]
MPDSVWEGQMHARILSFLRGPRRCRVRVFFSSTDTIQSLCFGVPAVKQALGRVCVQDRDAKKKDRRREEKHRRTAQNRSRKSEGKREAVERRRSLLAEAHMSCLLSDSLKRLCAPTPDTVRVAGGEERPETSTVILFVARQSGKEKKFARSEETDSVFLALSF